MRAPQRSRWPAALTGALLAAPAGCADDPACGDALRVCDIGSQDCQEHVFLQTACARGFGGGSAPPVDTISRQEFVELLRSGAPPSESERLADEQRATAMRMLRMTPASTTSDEDASIEALASGVLAFYDRDTRSVTIVEDNLGEVGRASEVFVLSHEFVHAQQDLDIDLQGFFDEHATTYDSGIALRCLTEGEAVHYSNLTMARQPGATISSTGFAEYYRAQQGDLWLLASNREAVSYADLALSFPYPFGGELVTERWFADGHAGVLALYDTPWASTGDVLRLLENEGLRTLPEIALAVPELPEGWTVLADDTFGAWMTYAFAHRNLVARSTAKALARDWSGDRLLVVAGAAANDVALAWRFRFGKESNAEILSAIGDMPPHEGAWSVTVDNADVTFVLGPDAASLPTWETAFEHAFAESPPSLRATAGKSRVAPPLRPPSRAKFDPRLRAEWRSAPTARGPEHLRGAASR